MTVRLPKRAKTLMPFGEYMGEYLEDVPTSYLEWLVNKGNLFGRLKKLIEKDLKSRDESYENGTSKNEEYKELRFD